MSTSLLPIVLAIDDADLRQQVEAALQQRNHAPERVGTSSETYYLTPSQHANALIMLETKDDTARLVQIVNDLYRSPYHPGGSVNVICIASEATLHQNLQLSWWLIDGHAAVFCVWARTWVFTELDNLLRFLEQEYEPSEAIPFASYGELVTEIVEHPNDGRPLLNLAKRLMLWQDDHQMSRELRLALLRHAARLMPDNEEAQILLAEVLARQRSE